MGEIHVHEFMSLDGVIDEPTWTIPFGFDPTMGEAIDRVTERCQAILLGRRTYETFEEGWSNRTEQDDPAAPFFNDTTKYVVSAKLTTTTWRNSQLIGEYNPDTIRDLKNQVDGNIYTAGSATLVRALLADGLVDELHLCMYPHTRGAGPRLFPEEAASRDLSRTACESYENGAVYIAYRPQA